MTQPHWPADLGSVEFDIFALGRSLSAPVSRVLSHALPNVSPRCAPLKCTSRRAQRPEVACNTQYNKCVLCVSARIRTMSRRRAAAALEGPFSIRHWRAETGKKHEWGFLGWSQEERGARRGWGGQNAFCIAPAKIMPKQTPPKRIEIQFNPTLAHALVALEHTSPVGWPVSYSIYIVLFVCRKTSPAGFIKRRARQTAALWHLSSQGPLIWRRERPDRRPDSASGRKQSSGCRWQWRKEDGERVTN